MPPCHISGLGAEYAERHYLAPRRQFGERYNARWRRRERTLTVSPMPRRRHGAFDITGMRREKRADTGHAVLGRNFYAILAPSPPAFRFGAERRDDGRCISILK